MTLAQDSECGIFKSRFGPIRCPNSGCGARYYTTQIAKCVSAEACLYWVPSPVCCGQYSTLVDGGDCIITEFKDPKARSRIFQFAGNNDILVPTFSGAYVPARIALRERKGGNHDGGLQTAETAVDYFSGGLLCGTEQPTVSRASRWTYKSTAKRGFHGPSSVIACREYRNARLL